MRKLAQYEYDTVSGIANFLKYYPHFHAVLDERRQARNRGDTLNEFVVLKAFTLDQFGQLGKIQPNSLVRNLMHDQPDCTTQKEFFAELQRRLPEDQHYGVTLSPVYLPSLNCRCAGCGKYYGTDDCYDVITAHENSVLMPLADFVGRQFWEVRRQLDLLPDQHFLDPSLLIRHDRFIDLNPDPYFGESESPRNSNGWVGKDDGIEDWYVIQPGDETMYDLTRYFHAACFKTWVTEKTRAEFVQLFSDAEVPVIRIDRIPNEYGSFEYRGPWFKVETPAGMIRIGWRKRVIEIKLEGEWPVDCNNLFVAENVTTSNDLVHAWSHEKAVSYLKMISQAAAN